LAIPSDKFNALYCGTGWRTSEAFLNAHVMGWNKIVIYDGGWYEWSKDLANPIAVGKSLYFKRCIANHEKRIICFFGRTVGNLHRQDAVQFIAKLGKLMQTGERLSLGLDMVKDKAILEMAYKDKR
jgi:hypothetical protein